MTALARPRIGRNRAETALPGVFEGKSRESPAQGPEDIVEVKFLQRWGGIPVGARRFMRPELAEDLTARGIVKRLDRPPHDKMIHGAPIAK